VTSSEPAAHIDVMPTLLAAAGVKPRAELKLDGRNLLPLLTGEAANWPERHLVLQWHRGDVPRMYRHFAIRRGPWKLLNRQGAGEAWREDESFSALNEAELAFELYNLEEDPLEELNLIEKHPQIAQELRAAYSDWFRDVSTTRQDNFDPPRMIIGSERQPIVELTRQDWRRTGGEGWGNLGQWQLEVERPADFAITVRLAKPFDGRSGKILVQAGGAQWSRPISPGARQVTFENVELPPGPLTLAAEAIAGDEVYGPHQVSIRLVRARK
jgi:arylsulfatase/arylsulfatase A